MLEVLETHPKVESNVKTSKGIVKNIKDLRKRETEQQKATRKLQEKLFSQ